MQVIESYSFGSITVSGKPFTSDVIIFPEEVVPGWWRKEGHYLHLEDLQEILRRKPDVLVIGTGYSGIMKVPDDLTAQLERKGMKVLVKTSREAVDEYNKLVKKGQRVAAALHLTC